MRIVTVVGLGCISAAALAQPPWIIRRDVRQADVGDAYVWAAARDANSGTSDVLYCGDVSGEKAVLVRFDVSFVPKGTRVTRADVVLTPSFASQEPVRVHAAVVPWNEDDVTWNSFDAGFDPVVLATFAPMDGAYDATSLVQQWVDGRPNQGFFLEQGLTAYSQFHSSNAPDVERRPRMELTLALPGPLEEAVLPVTGDAYVWSADPDVNFCCTGYDISGTVAGGEKVALVRFDVGSLPAGATVVSATLRLKHDPAHAVNTNRVQPGKQAWADATVTWTSFGGLPATPPEIAFFPTEDGGHTEVEVRSIVQPWVDGAPNFGFLLDQESSEATWWFSNEAAAELRPELRVRFVRPVPDAGTAGPDGGVPNPPVGPRVFGLGCAAVPREAGAWLLLALLSVRRRRPPRCR